MLVGLTFVIGAGEAFFIPAYRALLPSVVPDTLFEAANALTAVSRQVALIAGPALAGVIVAVASPATALWLDAATFAVSFATLLLVRSPAAERVAGERPSIRADVVEGFRVVAERPWIGLTILMAMTQLIFTLAPWFVLLPIISAEELGGTDVYGGLLALLGAGSVAGAVVASRWRPRLPGAVALVALLPSGLVLLTLLGPAPLAFIAVAVVVVGAGEAIFEVFWNSGLQRDVPGHVLARVFSLDYVGSLALMPVGLALTGPAVDALGRDTVLVAGCTVTVVTTLLLLARPDARRFAT